MPLGGFAHDDGAGRLAVAALALPSGLAWNGHRAIGVAVHGYGPGGAALAARLAERATAWDRLGRPGARSLELAVYPAGSRPQAIGGSVIRRPDSVLTAGWPAQS